MGGVLDGGSTTTTQRQRPWKPAVPGLKGAINKAQNKPDVFNIRPYKGPRVAETGELAQQGLDQTADAAGRAQEGIAGASAGVQDIIGGGGGVDQIAGVGGIDQISQPGQVAGVDQAQTDMFMKEAGGNALNEVNALFSGAGMVGPGAEGYGGSDHGETAGRRWMQAVAPELLRNQQVNNQLNTNIATGNRDANFVADQFNAGIQGQNLGRDLATQQFNAGIQGQNVGNVLAASGQAQGLAGAERMPIDMLMRGGAVQQQQDQAGLDARMAKQQERQRQPLDRLQREAGFYGGFAGLGGSGTQTQSERLGLLGALGGLGQAATGGFGAYNAFS